MTTLYIVRHGETEENLQQILQGHMPGTLTARGRAQVAEAGEQLAATGVRFSRIVASDLRRAMDSAQIIAERLTLPAITPMTILRERDWGKFTGMPIAEAAARFRIDGKWTFPDGTTETVEGIYERAGRALDELQRLYAGETIIVVTHGQFARNLVAAFNHCSYHEVTPFANAEVRTLTLGA